LDSVLYQTGPICQIQRTESNELRRGIQINAREEDGGKSNISGKLSSPLVEMV